jgi:hypothetical protein
MKMNKKIPSHSVVFFIRLVCSCGSKVGIARDLMMTLILLLLASGNQGYVDITRQNL